jgi:hypothetical protein
MHPHILRIHFAVIPFFAFILPTLIACSLLTPYYEQRTLPGLQFASVDLEHAHLVNKTVSQINSSSLLSTY